MRSMNTEKTLEPVQSEDETKPTGNQQEAPSQDDEIDTKVDLEEDESDEEDGDKKPFKDRKERADFFKKKQAQDKDSDVLKKSDLFKINEKRAIKLATEPHADDSGDIAALKQEINEHWSDIVRFFNPKTDRSEPDSILEGIMDAHAVWRRRTPKQGEKNSTDTDARAKLMREAGAKGSTGKGMSKEKKTILGRPSAGMDSWYPKED